MTGISYLHKIQDLEDHTKSFLVSKTLEGLKRSNPPKSDLRLPISVHLLKRIICSLQYVCSSTYEAALFASAYSLCFFALLRVGEVAAESKADSGVHVIKYFDISFVGRDLCLNIQSSKSDQLRKASTLIILQQKDESICPVRLLKQFLEIRSPLNFANLFIHFDGSNLTRYQFSALLQKSLAFCEVDGHFRPHSFRIGGCTEAKRAGIDGDTIKLWGRWSSNAYARYIRLNI